MKLKELLHGLDVLELHADEALDITGVQYDSRQVTPGALFVAISGFQTDGHKYIPKAAENGAACIVCEKKPEMQIPYVLVSDARAALAMLGANWFGHPADDMCVIGITGTNGKTTTVTLLGEIFRNAGRTTHVVGNIGYPYSAAGLDSQDGDLFVCEVSSFQMETAETFHPKAAALLNITEDHLNRHGTMEVYTAMKMRQFQNMTAEDVAVFNADDPALAPLIGQVKAQVMLFSRKREVEQGAFVRDGEIVVRFHGAEEMICPVKDVFIPGPHNLENALAACCIAAAMGVKPDVIAHTLRTFQGVEHRIEFVRELDGVRYINDSKGTNVDSTIKAIQTMTRPTAIILGGYDKHCDFTPMVQEMLASPYIKEAVLIGATADQIERTCRENGYTHLHRAGTLKDAIDQCRALSSDGWNVLLSPACASFDMFSDYESRGRIFKELVRELK